MPATYIIFPFSEKRARRLKGPLDNVLADGEKKFYVSDWDHETSIRHTKYHLRLFMRVFSTTRDHNKHLYSVIVDMKFLGSLGPVIHDTQGQSNVRSYAVKRQSGKK